MAQKKKAAQTAAEAAKATQAVQAAEAAHASKATKAAKVVKAVKAVKASEAADPVYPLDEIMQQSEALMGVKPEVLAGAYHSLPGGSLTVQEAKKQVQLFLNRKVK
ncbi:hypothetical protein QNH46_17315 [Paenibacillus woosongensis]|uniref:YqzN/YkzM domain-containing protein n=1 Tax=Paenibacillus woosongensis TaxID=307580 RepID=A0AA95I4W5_9BACL|nr:hypothetical protein [Paenibacillus woosongensis]WHX47884.1 hypothetical protein QNH46_17315 [Paenibacillus woosongensis]